MNSFDKLNNIRNLNNSKLCIGLDTVPEKLPGIFRQSPEGILQFNLEIIESTKSITCAYKLNFAFYERYGSEGFDVLKKTFDAIPKEIFKIADAKRGDIGNTSAYYAQACFGYFGADAVTVNAYMGKDSVMPFLDYKQKMIFILALTSNPGSADFQYLKCNGDSIYQNIVRKSSQWGDSRNIGYVVGATHHEELAILRNIVPDYFFLVPGIGTQGGNIEQTLAANGNTPVIINVSRDIIFTSSGNDYIERIFEKASFYRSLLNGQSA